MNYKLRHFILDHCKDGEQLPITPKHKQEYPLTLGLKPLSFGITPDGFPFMVWESRNFGSILVGESKWQEQPKSKLRNDTCESINLNTLEDRMKSACYMAGQIAY